MMDVLFTIIVSPLQTIYQFIYEGLYHLIKDYGLSLVCLSVVTAFLISPLEKVVGKYVAKEKQIESILRPQIKQIKSDSKGAEQSRRLRKLYSRYSYNPIYSIRSAFGVLLQLPFLLGAYWMLSSLEELNGISFGFIKDLSKPDGLFFGFNLLPFIMTAINLGAVALMRNMTKKERIQSSLIAVAFLVILYNAPAALLVYWTGNNTILASRLILERLINFKNKPLFAYEIRFQWTCEQQIAFFTYLAGIASVFLTLDHFNLSLKAIHSLKAFSDIAFVSILLFITVPYFRQ